MCSMYKNIDDGAFIGRKQYSVLMFKVNFLGLGLLYSFFLFFFFFCLFFFNIYIHILKTQCIFNPCNELSANDS
jgi:hypothetical protein